MQRHRILIVFGIAWVSALLLSWWVYKKSTVPQAQQRDLVSIVAASRDLPMGKRLQAEDMKLIALDRKDQPKGAFLKVADLVDRALTAPAVANEPLLPVKLASKGSGEGITAMIEPGSRAISVAVNEISGVAGFVQPGTRVDVLFTRIFTNGDAATTTILQNIKVIAYGKQFDSAVKADPRDNSKPTVATLLVTQEQAEKLVLAGQRGKIQLLLRNPSDQVVSDIPDAVRSTDLGIDEPPKSVPVPARSRLLPSPAVSKLPVPAAPAARVIKPEPEGHLVRIFRGDKLTETRFQ